MNEFKVKISAALSPIMRYLYESGIIAVEGHGASVQVTEKFFRETFPVYETVQTENHTELRYEFEGVTFFCLTDR